MNAAIEVKNLTNDFFIPSQSSRLRAVDDLSFSVPRGCVFGLLGPNGSGKSTTIKSILNMLQPDSGECWIEGISSKDIRSRERVGYLPEGPFYYKFLEGLEFVALIGQLGGLSKRESISRGRALMVRVGLEDACERRIHGYSKGMLQRLGLAQSLVNDPDVLILDEPTAGVDPVGAVEITNIIAELKAEGKTVLLCSHLLTQVESVCDEVAILSRGKLVVSGTMEALLELGDERIELHDCPIETLNKVKALVGAVGGSVKHLRERRSLEDLFIELSLEKTGGDK